MRFATIATTLFLLCAPLSAQDDPAPAGLAAIELERSRSCVGILARVDALDAVLEPMATRSQRLLAVAQAIALEDRSVVDSLHAEDPVEAQVRAWFIEDGTLAEQYATLGTTDIAQARADGREAIKTTVADALAAVQTEADEIMAQDSELGTEAGGCSGAIFVRKAVLEMCATATGSLCDEAKEPPSAESQFRFVESANNMWGIQDLRPWTSPGPLAPGPTGQLDGGRTVGYARVGNLVITLAFQPFLRDREEATPEELQSYQVVNDSLGLEFSHPNFAFTPALGIRVALPEPLENESSYIIHFGAPQDPDVVWTGAVGTGQPLEAMIPLSAAHVTRLQAGEPLSLAAMRDGGAGIDEPIFGIELTTINQGPAAQALLGYMASQLSADLLSLIKPGGA